MNLTEFFRLRKPEGSDPVNIKDLNDNFDVIDTELNKRPSSTGAASDMTVNFTQAESRANLKTGEKLSTAMGKIAKWYEDLKSVAWSGRYTDLSERPTLGGAAAMGVADNDTTNNANFLPTARVVYEHGKEIDALNSEMQLRLPEHLAFGMDADGNWGYKIGGADPVIPFRGRGSTLAILNEYQWPPQNGKRTHYWIPARINASYFKAVSDKPEDGLLVRRNVTLIFNGMCGYPVDASGKINFMRGDTIVYSDSHSNDGYYHILNGLLKYSDPIAFSAGDVLKIQTITDIGQTNAGVYAYGLIYIDLP